MSIKESTQEYRLSQWLPIIKECRNSGMHVKTWCKKNDIDPQRFYYWQRKIRAAALNTLPTTTAQPSFVELTVPVEKTVISQSPTFVPTMILKVGDISLELSEDVKPELLASVLKVITDA